MEVSAGSVPSCSPDRLNSSNRTVILTGASSGIGAAIATSLVHSGRRVVAVARHEERLNQLRERLGPSFEPSPLDLEDDAALDDFVHRVDASGEPLGGLIHCAGVVVPGEIGALSPDLVDRMMRVNFRAPLLLTNALVELLAASAGHLIFVNSTAALAPAPGRSVYTASKYALRALADTARLELNDRGIRVASVYPGRTATPGIEAVFAREGKSYDRAALLQPEDIARAVMGIIEAPDHVEVMDVALRPRWKSY